jgi:molecular chaperone DnaK
VSQKLGEKMYAQAGAEAGQGGAQPGAGAAAGGGGAEPKNDDVVDADYKEVKRG